MQTHSNTENRLTDELIESCMEPVRRLAGSYARKLYRVEFEELFSIGMVAACEAAARVSALETAVAYMCKCAQGRMLDEIQRVYGHTSVSLDAPLTDSDDAGSLYDVLAAPALTSVSGRTSKRVRAVRQAVNRLPVRRKQYVLRFYGLEGHGRHSDTETGRALGVTASGVRSMTRHARQALQQDVKLRKAMGVQ